MGKIIILDEITANKIAAGEVVERPASVVKEMVENSIDAGATNITVDIKNGGITQIKIIDNGSGIAPDDVQIAFERHSTSKIKSAFDLDNISTLGFRGEALASISSVSKVELISREKTMEQGMRVKVEGGRLVESVPKGCPVGTTFIIRDLFYNTPARYKFLKKDTTEANYILDIVNRIALARPDISFKFINKDKIMLHTPGNGDLKSTIFSIYGKDVANEILEVNYKDANITITGFVGKPEIARGTRNQQSLYLNKRYIKSKLVLKAVEEAYKTFLMKGKFPFYVLNMEINPMLVDINVHPTKMEVRFSNEQDIFRGVHNAVSNVLLDKSDYRVGQLPKKAVNPFEVKKEYVQNTFIKSSFQGNTPKISQDEELIEKMIQENIKQNRWVSEQKDEIINEKNSIIEEPIKKEAEKESLEIFDNTIEENVNINKLEVTTEAIAEQNELIPEKVEYVKEQDIKDNPVVESYNMVEEPTKEATEQIKIIEEEPEKITNNLLVDCIIIGQLFRTYILLQKDNEFYIIDQHAAHERVMYEKLKKRYKKNENMSQELISPIIVEMPAGDIKKILNGKEKLERLGFEIEEFGINTLIIRAVPAFGEEDNVKQYFLETVDSLILKDKEDDEVLDETLHNIACKSAIKAHKKMDTKEIYELLKQLDELENPFTCPHGRPTALKITKYEIEKMFKRIV